MELFNSLKVVAETAIPIQNGTMITDENRAKCVKEMEEFIFAVVLAKRSGATGFEIAEATAGRVDKEGILNVW